MVSTCCASSRAARSLADSLATHPEYFSDLYINMVRAGEASGALAVVFERLAEFERTRDELRNYIISSMIYPALLACVGLASMLILLIFRGAALRHHLRRHHHEDPDAHPDHAGGQQRRARLVVDGRGGPGGAGGLLARLHHDHGRPFVVGRLPAEDAAARAGAAQGRNLALRPRHGDAGGQHRAAGAIHRHFRRHVEQPHPLAGAGRRGARA